MQLLGPRLLLPALAAALFLGALPGADSKPETGPQTEKRFPPLKVPAGFRATLFACDPLIEYPSAIAIGPRPGSLFVAADFMTGLGEGIERRDEIRLIEDIDGDGYADRSTVFADKLNSVQGLAYHNGTLFVMHAPYLTAFRAAKGKDVADERRDLLTGLGLSPEKDRIRLHNANGVVVGHDGWLYLALGDHGCDITRPEGDRLVLRGGGILRCRPDGRDLHVFASGLRNIYDLALDADLNVFLRDNENDGGTYMIRVYHSFFGADHGYPYHYEERPDEALPPLADLGLGSSAGGVCYLERQFPPEYRGDLFFCEWGRSVVRYRPEPRGSSFGPLKEFEFAAGAENDPYGFKPTDLVVERDGSLLVADWADGQRPRRGRGRIYRIHYAGKEGKPVPSKPAPEGLPGCLAQLDSTSLADREEAQSALERLGPDGRAAVRKALKDGQLGLLARLHAVWILARDGGAATMEDLFALARSDAEPRVQAQAVRALADRCDPLLIQHRLDAGPGDADVAKRLAGLAPRDPRVMLEVVVALGRLRWSETPAWLQAHLKAPDAALAHAAMQALRGSRNWPALLKLLDGPDTEPMRAIAVRALSERTELSVVDGLLERLKNDPVPARRRQYADMLTRVARKPGPYVYWGFRPAPRTPNSVAWERTEAIAAALDRMLADPDRATRLAVLQHMRREKIAVRLATVSPWLREEREPARVAVLLEALRDQPAAPARDLLLAVVQDRAHRADNRLTALAIVVQGLDAQSEGKVLDLAEVAEDGPVLAAAVRQLGKRPALKSVPLLKRKLASDNAEVRAAALEALAELRSPEGNAPARQLLEDRDARVRQAAAKAAGKLGVRAAVDGLLKAAGDPESDVRRASLDALRELREPRALPLAVAGLADPATQTPALDCIAELGGPEQVSALTDLLRRNPSPDLVARVVRLLTTWSTKDGVPAAARRELDNAVAEIQGTSGSLSRWRVTGPLAAAVVDSLVETIAKPSAALDTGKEARWRAVFAGGDRLRLDTGKPTADTAWLALTDLAVREPAVVQFQVACPGGLAIWLNGKPVHKHEGRSADFTRFNAELPKGTNRLVARVSGADFQLRFRRQSARAEHEKLMAAALARRGDPRRGKKLFLDVEKSLCLKCHRLEEQGERIGPELTGVGARFARAYLVESILEPSRTIAPSFDTITVTLKTGKLVSGIKLAETPQTLTLGDTQGQKHVLAKTDVEERQVSPLSTMPEGLEKRFTEEEFIDLIEFLVNQKAARAR
jgi:putative membrane-bound dehydrogenase-like protein